MMIHPDPLSSPVVAYRAFTIDPASGHVQHAPTIIEAHDDHEALGRAVDIVRSEAVELWDGARLVQRIAPRVMVAAALGLD